MTPSEYRQIIEETWVLVESHGLRGVDADSIAKVASIPVAKVRSILPDQGAIILLLVANILSKIQIVPNQLLSEQDRLFDAIMQGFDMAEQHKQAIAKLWNEIMWKPWMWPQILPPFQKKLDEIVEILMTKNGFLQEAFTHLGIRAVFLNTFLAWVEDETLDLSKTMAALDQSLKQYYELNQYVP